MRMWGEKTRDPYLRPGPLVALAVPLVPLPAPPFPHYPARALATFLGAAAPVLPLFALRLLLVPLVPTPPLPHPAPRALATSPEGPPFLQPLSKLLRLPLPPLPEDPAGALGTSLALFRFRWPLAVPPLV